MISVVHDAIMVILNVTNTSHQRLANDIITSIPSITNTEQKVKTVQDLCEIYVNGLFETYEGIKYQIQKVQNIVKWIDLKAEPIELTEQK